jgi:Dolichyl-phosphate-mannose-protein mannosyltransferase
VTFSISRDVEPRLPAAAQSAQSALSSPPRPSRVPRAARLAAAVAGLAAIGAYLFVALSRLDYPFAVQPLEGNSLVEVHRILAGQSLYPAPSAGYVPDGYTPLYFYVAAGAARVLGVSYLPLRLVSLLSSLACFALLARLVQRETGSRAAGVGAAGVFAATYFVTGTWFDVARVDSLFLALSIGGLYAVRQMRDTRGAVVAGVLLAAAALTKQTGLAEGVAVFAVLVIGPRRRLAWVAAVAEFAVFGISTLALRLTSGGWYTYYVFKQMSEHALDLRNFGWFCTLTLTAMGLAGLAALIAARRVPRELLAGCAALAVEGCATLVHSGGSVNDVLPAYLALALLAGLALGSDSSRWGAAAAGALVLAQSVFLLATAHPSQSIPTSADRAAGERLVAGMRAFGGDVVFPGDPALSLQAGMAPAAHPAAVYDVLRATDKAGIDSYRHSAEEAVTTRRFSAFVSDSPGLPLNGPPSLLKDYHECVQPVPTLFAPAAGSTVLQPVTLWIPWGGVSCQAAFRIFDTGKAGRS